MKKFMGLGLISLILAITASIFFLRSNVTYEIQPISFAEWPDSISFKPVMLDLPAASDIAIMGPSFHKNTNFVEVSYIAQEATPEIPKGTLHLFQSDSFEPFLTPIGIMKTYKAEREDVIITRTELTLSGQPTAVDIHRNKQLSMEGVALFEINGTHVVYDWQGMTKTEAIQILEKHVKF